MEFLFIGKDITGKWIVSSSLWKGRGIDLFVENTWIPAYPETVGQYVGQRDGEGNKVFDGDILFLLFFAFWRN